MSFEKDIESILRILIKSLIKDNRLLNGKRFGIERLSVHDF